MRCPFCGKEDTQVKDLEPVMMEQLSEEEGYVQVVALVLLPLKEFNFETYQL